MMVISTWRIAVYSGESIGTNKVNSQRMFCYPVDLSEQVKIFIFCVNELTTDCNIVVADMMCLHDLPEDGVETMQLNSDFLYNCLYHLTQIRHTPSCMSHTVLVWWCRRPPAMKVVFLQFTTILEPVMPQTSWTGTACVHHIWVLSQASTPFGSLAKFYVDLVTNHFPHSEAFYLMHSFWTQKQLNNSAVCRGYACHEVLDGTCCMCVCVCTYINKFCRYTGVSLHTKFNLHSSNGSLVITNNWKSLSCCFTFNTNAILTSCQSYRNKMKFKSLPTAIFIFMVVGWILLHDNAISHIALLVKQFIGQKQTLMLNNK